MSKNTNLSFLTDYITADITNGRIGINNASPTVAFDVVGATKITGVLTLTSTISNGTYTYTLPSATGTLALTSALSGYLPLTGGTLTGALGGTSATFSSTLTSVGATINGANNAIIDLYNTALADTNARNWRIVTNESSWGALEFRVSTANNNAPSSAKLILAKDGAATFTTATNSGITIQTPDVVTLKMLGTAGTSTNWGFARSNLASGDFGIYKSTSVGGEPISAGTSALYFLNTGAATFSSSVSATSLRSSAVGTFGFNTANNGEFQIYATALDGMIMAGRGSNYDMVITNKSGNDVFRIPTGTTTANFVGNVGIGTTSPTTKLTVYGGYANFTDGTVDIYAGSDGSGGLFGTISNQYQRFITNNTERMRITSAGNVGIGTTSPSTYGFFVVNSSNESSGVSTVIRNQTDVGGDNTRYAGVDFMIGSDNGTAAVRAYRTNSAVDYQTALTFWTKGSGAGATSPTERMRITAAGAVGIGTSAPADYGIYRQLVVYGGSTGGGLTIASTGTATGILAFANGTTGTSQYKGYIEYQHANDAMAFATNATERMRITSTGLVGIGTSSPADKLSIYTTTAPTLDGSVNAQSLSYNGGDADNSLGAGIVFSQRFDATNTSIVRVGGIYGVKTTATGGFGGGLAFYTQPASSANMVERMRITSGGNVGINTTSPNYKMQVNSPSGDWGLHVKGVTTASSSYGLFIDAGTNNADLSFLIRNSSGAATYFQIRGDGLMSSIPTYNNTYGNVANTYIGSDGFMGRSTASSQRFKDNISDWGTNGLDTILALKPRTYTYKKDYYSQPNRKFLGLIAEEVAEVSHYLADFQNEDGSGEVENVRYATIVVPLIAAIQELSAEITLLKQK